MTKLSQKVELSANVLIVVVSLLLIGFLAQRYFFAPAPVAKQQQRITPTVGKKLELENVDFSGRAKTVVLALQTTCRFCTESAPFYKRLVQETKDRNINYVAVFPTPVSDSQEYLNKLGVSGLEVRQSPLTKLETSSTPTLIVVNSRGEIENSWVGQLPADKEVEVLNQLNSNP